MILSLSFICGLVGNILFGLKSIFQVIKCYRSKSTDGLSIGMLLADFGGNICCTYYIFFNAGFKLFWQYVNYGIATLLLIVLFIMMYIYRDRNKQK